MLRHRKRIVAVVLTAGALGLAAWALVPDTRAQAQQPDPATLLFVDHISVAFSYAGGARRQPFAVMFIVDGYGRPVNDALVVGDWSGCFKEKGDSDLTHTVCHLQDDGTTICWDGVANIESKRTYSCWGGGKGNQCSFTFTVTGVFLEGMTYVPIAGKTTASAPCF